MARKIKAKVKVTRCGKCPYGEKKLVVGNWITEPPYISVIRCPYDNEYYKYPDDKCNHMKGRKYDNG